jgi:hypothetical protein
VKSILIIAEPDDLHANAVSWAVERLGLSATRWSSLDLTPLSMSLSNGTFQWTFDSCVTAWIRHPNNTASAALDPADRIFAERELRYFQRGLFSAMASSTMVANHPRAKSLAELKAPQLIAARNAGLSIPETLFSNDPDAVRSFLQGSDGRVIYKSHSPAVWASEGKTYAVYTTFLSEADLAGVDAAHFNPGIFQRYVPKARELRVSIFGRTCVAASLSNGHELDWRIDHKMNVTPYSLPRDVEERLLRCMDELGLAMGMVDMIVTPEGDHVFLEVNEQGQFLWVELMNPEIPVLETCARFLASGDPAFSWSAPAKPLLALEDYAKSDANESFRAHIATSGRQPNSWVIDEAAVH